MAGDLPTARCLLSRDALGTGTEAENVVRGL